MDLRLSAHVGMTNHCNRQHNFLSGKKYHLHFLLTVFIWPVKLQVSVQKYQSCSLCAKLGWIDLLILEQNDVEHVKSLQMRDTVTGDRQISLIVMLTYAFNWSELKKMKTINGRFKPYVHVNFNWYIDTQRILTGCVYVLEQRDYSGLTSLWRPLWKEN